MRTVLPCLESIIRATVRVKVLPGMMSVLFAITTFKSPRISCFFSGDRAHVERFEDYVQDYLAFAKKVAIENDGRRLFLIGHSMGGAIAY